MKRFLSNLVACFSKSRPNRSRPAPQRARLEVENLEGRELLSTTPLLSAIKLTPTVTVRDSGGTYNGRPYAATATATTAQGVAVSGSMSFTYWNGVYASGVGSSTTPTQAGAYTVVASFTSTNPSYNNARSSPVTFAIAPATPTVTMTNTVGTEALVPAYFYPTGGSSGWNQLDTAASSIHLTAIMNPNSGPGSGVDANYVAAVSKLQSVGGQVIGYVHTSYGTRSLATVEAEINEYRSWYHVNGIFVDEMTNDSSTAHLQYYQTIYQYAHSLQSNWTVVGNPGTNTTEDYVRMPLADVLVAYENDTNSNSYSSYSPASWQQKYAPTHFANIVYNVTSVAAMQADVKLAANRGTGWLYVTNYGDPNPYGALPTYWNQFVSALSSTAGVVQPLHPTAKTIGVNGAAVSGFYYFIYYSGTSVHGVGTTTPPVAHGTYSLVAEFLSWDINYTSALSTPYTFTI